MYLICHRIETAAQQGKAHHGARSPAVNTDAQRAIHQYTKDKISNNMSALAYKKRQESRAYPWHSLLQMANDHPALPTRDGGGLIGEDEDDQGPATNNYVITYDGCFLLCICHIAYIIYGEAFCLGIF